MAESPLKPLCNPNSLGYVTVAWYCVFYSPMDLCYQIFKKFPFNSVLVVCAEIYRCGNIQSGVKYAMKSSLAKDVKLKPLLMIIIGCVKGCGGSLARGAIRLVRSAALKRRSGSVLGGVTSVDNEFQTPTFFTKVSFLAAAIFTGYWISAIPPQFDYAMIHVSVHFFFITQRLMMSLAPDSQSLDPFSTVENLFCLVFFGRESTPSSSSGVDFSADFSAESEAGQGGGEDDETSAGGGRDIGAGGDRTNGGAKRRGGKKDD